MSESTIKASTGAEIDAAFENGEDMARYFDLSAARTVRPQAEMEQKAMSLVLPAWLMGVLDAEAERCGVSRAALTKMWLVERADDERRKAAGLARIA